MIIIMIMIKIMIMIMITILIVIMAKVMIMIMIMIEIMIMTRIASVALNAQKKSSCRAKGNTKRNVELHGPYYVSCAPLVSGLRRLFLANTNI